MWRFVMTMGLALLLVLAVACNNRASDSTSGGPPVIAPPSTGLAKSNSVVDDTPVAVDSATGVVASAAPALSVAPPDGIEVPSSEGHFQVSGVAMAARTSMLSAKGQGLLRSLKVREGDKVKAGQVLCVLDTVMVSLQAQAAAADQAQAMAALEDARRDLQRASVLADAGAMAEQMKEKAQLGENIAKLRSEAAAVAVRMTQQAMADTSLRAPFDGVISKVLAEEGQFITVMPPSPVFLLVDISRLQVRVPIPERMILHVRAGIPVKVHLPAVKVTRDAKIDRMAEVIDPMTRSAEAVIYLDNKDGALPAGLFASVVFPSLSSNLSDGVANQGTR